MERHERLRFARKRHFATAKEAAASLGVPYGTYSGHETGSRGFKVDELTLYARRFHVSQSWLAFGDGDPDASKSDQPALADGRLVTERENGAGLGDQGSETWTSTQAPPDRTYIQVELSALRTLVSGALQNESIPEEQADAYADAVLGSLRERAYASLVLRLEELPHNDAVSPRLKLGDRS